MSSELNPLCNVLIVILAQIQETRALVLVEKLSMVLDTMRQYKCSLVKELVNNWLCQQGSFPVKVISLNVQHASTNLKAILIDHSTICDLET